MGIEAYPPVDSEASSYLTASAFQWVSFTPTWVVTGAALTNYTIAGKYLKTGSLCHISMYVYPVTMRTTASVSATAQSGGALSSESASERFVSLYKGGYAAGAYDYLSAFTASADI